MDGFQVYVTPAQLDAVLVHKDGSESLDNAIANGLTWTKTKITVPAAAAESFVFFVGMRGDISRDNLELCQPTESLPSERGEWRATLNLVRKVEGIIGRPA